MLVSGRIQGNWWEFVENKIFSSGSPNWTSSYCTVWFYDIWTCIIFLTWLADAESCPVALCNASGKITAWVVVDGTWIKRLLTQVTSEEWGTDAFKYSRNGRLKAGGTILAGIAITFIHIFCANWPLPAWTTCAATKTLNRKVISLMDHWATNSHTSVLYLNTLTLLQTFILKGGQYNI